MLVGEFKQEKLAKQDVKDCLKKNGKQRDKGFKTSRNGLPPGNARASNIYLTSAAAHILIYNYIKSTHAQNMQSSFDSSGGRGLDPCHHG